MVNLKASKNDDRLLLKRKAKTNVVTNIEVSKKLEFFKYHILIKLKVKKSLRNKYKVCLLIFRTSVRRKTFVSFKIFL